MLGEPAADRPRSRAVRREARSSASSRGFDPTWLATTLAYVVGVVAVVTLVQASRIYVLGPMRVTYALATNRQVPSAIGRLHRKYGTPYVAATAVALVASGLALLDDPELLIAIFAFGALLTFSIANLSIIVLRFREPRRDARLPRAVLDPDRQGFAADPVADRASSRRSARSSA